MEGGLKIAAVAHAAGLMSIQDTFVPLVAICLPSKTAHLLPCKLPAKAPTYRPLK